jgi:hypothetical protein
MFGNTQKRLFKIEQLEERIAPGKLSDCDDGHKDKDDHDHHGHKDKDDHDHHDHKDKDDHDHKDKDDC